MSRLALRAAQILAALAILWAGLSAHRWAGAAHVAAESRERAQSLASRAAEIAALTAQRPTALQSSRPAESISGPIRGALRAAGLADESLRSVAAATDEPAGTGTSGSAYRRLSILVQIAPLTTRQLGAFLWSWSKAEPAWVVTKLDLAHAGPDTDPDSTYDLRMSIATTYTAAPDANPSGSLLHP